jgi:site-specific recombinase
MLVEARPRTRGKLRHDVAQLRACAAATAAAQTARCETEGYMMPPRDMQVSRVPRGILPGRTHRPSAVPLTTLARILESFPPARRDEPLVRGLAQRLSALIDAPELPERLRAFVAVIEWGRGGGAEEAVRLEGRDASVGGRYSRWMLLLDTLERDPQARSGFQQTIAEIIAETEGENLFADAGLPGERGFVAEFGDRLMNKLLPAPLDEHDLARLLTRCYRTREHAERFRGLPPEVFEQMALLFAPLERPEMWTAVREAFADGFRLLAARVQAQGLTEKMRARTRRMRVQESPFFRLTHASEAVLSTRGTAELAQAASAWRAEHDACRALMEQIRQRLEAEGVSVDVVYGLEMLDRCLTRMAAMLAVIESPLGAARAAAVHALLAQLIDATSQDRSLGHLVRANLRLLQRKIIERAGQTGEHYIAWTRREYWHIWLAAAGGGLLTVLTAANKAVIHELDVPLFVGGLLSGVNYAVSFLLLQAFGLILATKQPAMTAAALGKIMREHHGADRLDTIVTHAAQIVRSQLAAAISNVLLVSAGAYAFSLLWQAASGHPYVDREHAGHMLETLSPVNSLTVLYAALTGVILWLASLIGGWFDNWAVYHRLAQAISEHPLGQRVGRPRMVKLAGVVSRNIAGWGTNVSLGLMLGMTPAIGAFLGLPLDVRHVTLNSGMVALATAGLGADWMVRGWFLLAVAGVGTMFVLNLGVSFTLALYTAARAFGLPRGFLWAFFAALARRFVREPGRFLLPPGRDEQPPADIAGKRH